MGSRIEALARRLEGDPTFLASSLAAYAGSEHLDEESLAAALGCTVEMLAPLRLCRRPRVEPALFQADIAAIAARFPVNTIVLAEAVRRADALARLRGTASERQGLLMAARDRDHDRDESEAPQGEP